MKSEGLQNCFSKLAQNFPTFVVFGIVNGVRAEKFGAAVYLGKKRLGALSVCSGGFWSAFPRFKVTGV
jgi:hypothetical protein